MALSCLKLEPRVLAMSLASVVLPTPGGPQSTKLIDPESLVSISLRSGVPSPIISV
jgi:hypothetical protein